MIHFITGAVNQGKSTRLLNIYRSLQMGDGFYNRKIYRGDSLAGQEIVHLASGASKLFSLREGFIPERERFTLDRKILFPAGESLFPADWEEECRYDAFRFSRAGLNFGREIIRNALERQLELIFIDEVGPLELAGQGFYETVKASIAASINIYLVVRSNCLPEVIEKFSIIRYQVV
jgi:nucleoside-triphosphatase THEP1